MTDQAQVTKTAPASALAGLELGLLRTTWRLLRTHWWKLLIIAMCAYTAKALMMELALLAYALGALPGLMAFSLVPVVPLLAAIASLLLLRQHEDAQGMTAAFVAIGSVLIPFLVVYETQGEFQLDIHNFSLAGFNNVSEAQFAAQNNGEEFDSSAYDALTLDRGAPVVLATVVVAFLLRIVGLRLAEKESLWEGGKRRHLRTALRLAGGYSEALWIVVGAAVINQGINVIRSWWQQRAIIDAIADWWDGLSLTLPALTAVGHTLITGLGLVLDGAFTALIAPAAWLAIGAIVFGRSAANTMDSKEVVAEVGKRIGKASKRINPALVALTWKQIANPEGRFGALLGGAAMILRSKYLPLLVYCIVYTVVVTWVPYGLWEIASLIGGTRLESVDWSAISPFIDTLSYIVTLCLTMPLIAVYTDGLLQRFGAQPSLRLLPHRIGNSK